MEVGERPAFVVPVGGTIDDTVFETGGQRAAARDILEWWPESRNFSALARRGDWSRKHYEKVFKRYFTESTKEQWEALVEDTPAGSGDVDLPDSPEAAYQLGRREGEREGYRQGYRDGLKEQLDS